MLTSRVKRSGMAKKRMNIPRRNSSSVLPCSSNGKHYVQSSPTINRVASDEFTCRSTGRDSSQLNSFNDMGHLSRRIFNEGGENHLTSSDFDNSFGYRKVFENELECAAITPITIAKCIGSIVLGLVVRGEKKYKNGHKNEKLYEEFCG